MKTLWKIFLLIVRSISIIWAVAMAFGFILFLFDGCFGNDHQISPKTSIKELSKRVYIPNPLTPEDTTSAYFMQHTRVWKDYKRKWYDVELLMSNEHFNKGFENRLSIKTVNLKGSDYAAFRKKYKSLHRKDFDTFYWSWIYSELARGDKDLLGTLYLAFDSLKAQQNPSRKEFANMIMSCIQDIPYVLVHSKSCSKVVSNDTKCRTYTCRHHRDGKACRANTRYGILSPAEFVYTLEGDCDTRAVLLYLVLKHYSYDVKILVSEVYAHAILGINISSTGKYVRYNGKKYYAWETTARNWQIGQMPASKGNMKYWNVVRTKD